MTPELLVALDAMQDCDDDEVTLEALALLEQLWGRVLLSNRFSFHWPSTSSAGNREGVAARRRMSSTWSLTHGRLNQSQSTSYPWGRSWSGSGSVGGSRSTSVSGWYQPPQV